MKGAILINYIFSNSKLKNQATSSRIHPLDKKRINEAYVLGTQTLQYINPKTFEANSSEEMTKRMTNGITLFESIRHLTMPTGKTFETPKQLSGRVTAYAQAIQQYYMPTHTPIDINAQVQAYNMAQKNGQFISFDIENIGGQDLFGVNRFDGMTELAYTISDTQNQDANVALKNTKDYFFGINKETYKELSKEIRQVGFATSSGRGEVIANRLAIYGDSATKIDGNHIISEADVGVSVPSVAQMQKGLDVLLAAGILDESTLAPDGLTDGDRFIKTFESHANQKGTVIAGHNIINFDAVKLATQGIDVSHATKLDTLAIMQAASKSLTEKEIYEIAEDVSKGMVGKSTYSQENIIARISGKQTQNLQAHAAGVDSALHSLIVNHPIMQNAINHLDSDGVRALELGELVPNQSLILNKKSSYKDYQSLSFLSLPTGELNTGNGFSVIDGKVIDNGFKPGIMKKDALYLFGGTGQLKLTLEEQKAMQLINGDYAQEELYYSIYKPYGMEDTIQGNGTVAELFKSKEHLEARMNSHLHIADKIGDNQFELPSHPNARVRALEELIEYDLTQDKPVGKALELNQYLKKKTFQAKSDRAGKRVRNHDLNDVERGLKFIEDVKSYADKYKLTQPITGVSASDMKLSVMLANNERVTIDDGIELISKQFKNNPKYNSMDNLVGIMPFMYKNQEAIKQVQSYVEGHYADKTQRSQAYQSIMRQVIDNVNTDTQPLLLSKQDLNYVEVPLSRLATDPKKGKIIQSAEDLIPSYLRINLDANSAGPSLVKSLFANKFEGHEKTFTGENAELQGRVVLDDLAKVLRLDIDVNEYDKANSAADAIIIELRKQKEKNAYYGIHQKTSKQLVENGVVSISELYAKSNLSLDDAINQAAKHVPVVQSLSGADPLHLAKKVVDNFNTKVDANYFYDFGFDKKHADYMTHVYSQWKKEQESFYNSVFKNLKDYEGLGLILDDKQFALTYGGKAYDMKQYIPRLKVADDMAYVEVGNMQVALEGVIRQIPGADGQFELATNFQRSVDNTPINYTTAKRQIKDGTRNPAEVIEGMFKQVNSSIRTSPDIKAKNRMNQIRQFDIDFNDVRSYIPVLVQNGDIQVTKSQLEVLKRFSDPKKTGRMGALQNGGNATLESILSKYINQASAILFDTDAYQGSLVRTVAQYSLPYASEKRVSEGFLSFAPNVDAFGEYGPGNRITRFQNNFMSYDTKIAKNNLEALISVPKHSIDQGATSHFGYRKGVSRLVDFQKLGKEYSDQIVIKKLNISHDTFKEMIDKYFSGGPKDNYTEAQWTKIREKMRQYGLNEDESIMDARMLENVFWQQNEVQKVRERRSAENDFVKDKQFNKTHASLDYKITTKYAEDGTPQAVFKYGGSIERKRNDPLFKISGYHNTESLTLASYDGDLKKGLFTGKENIMLTEADINVLIEGMNKEQAESYINELQSYYYLDRKNKEQYVKYIIGNTEKTKSRSLTFKLGELDEELKKKFPSLAGSSAPIKELKERALGLGATPEDIIKIEREHYAVDIHRNLALGDKDIAFVTNPKVLKHKGTDTELRGLFPSLRQYHMDEEDMSAKEAALEVKKNFKNLGFNFDVAEDGSMLFEDEAALRSMELDGIRDVVKKKYSSRIDPELLSEKVFDKDNKLIGTTSMINAARTKEYEISIVTQPVRSTSQHREISQNISSVQNKIKAREMLLQELTTSEDIQVANDEPWYEEYNKLKDNIASRKKNTDVAIKNIETRLDINIETQNHLKQLNSCTKDYDEINKSIAKREKKAKQYTALINDPNMSDAQKKKYITLANENAKMLKYSKELKTQIVDDRQTAMFVYINALEQNVKNKREVQRAIGMANYKMNDYQNKLPQSLEREIKGYKKVAQNLERDLSDFSSAYKLKNKGITVDERALSKLRNKKLTTTIFENLKQTTSSAILEKFNLTSETAGNRPIFNTIVNDLIEMGLTNSVHDLLTPTTAAETIDKLYGDSKVGQGILGVFNHSKRDKLSIEVAEARYALSRMDSALSFNENRKTADYMKKIGFEEIDIRHYQSSKGYDASFLQQGSSVFGKNLILNVNGEKVAVPYMPHSVYGKSVVQKQYESAITRLQKTVGDLDELNPDEDKVMFENAGKKVTQAIENVKDSVHLITAKGGRVADTVTKSKYDLGFMAKSASYEGIQDADLDKAFYKGRSIKDWQTDGVFINAGFTSREMFEGKGFFSEELKDSFKDGDVLFGEVTVKGRITDEELEAIYKKHGISGLSGRFPYIQEMSINAKQLYLSDNIEGNTIKNFIAEQQRKSSDNDGDLEAFMALKVKTITGDYKNAFVSQALGESNEVFDEFNAAIGMDALGGNKYRYTSSREKGRFADEKLEESSKILKQAEVYDRMFFDGKLIGEATENPYFDKSFSMSQVNDKLAELETLTGKSLNLDKPNEVAQLINSLDDTADKEGYKKAVVDRLSVSGMNLALTAKTMKNAIGEVNLMMLDFDQSAEILANNNYITEREKKAVAEMSYAIQQESISPKNAKDGDINLDSIEDFKRIVNAAKFGQPLDYEGKGRTATEALGLYLDKNVRESYIEKYSGTESPEFIFESQKERQAIFNLDIDDAEKDELWEAKEQELLEGYYSESKGAMQRVLGMVSTPEVQNVSAYNKMFTRSEVTAKFYNTEAARKGVTTMQSQKDMIMQMEDDNAMAFGIENVENMLNPENSTYRYMFSNEEDLAEMANKAAARRGVTESLTKNANHDFKLTKGAAGIAIAGIGAYMLMGAMGSSVTANTTNQAEGMETTGDTLSDYGSDYQPAANYTQANRGYVINVNAKTTPQNVQKIAGTVNQSISNSLNANLNMTLNINESPLKQFQVNKLIQDSLFSN